MEHIYTHIGYYNEVGDIRELSRKPADEIIEYFKDGYGAFYEDRYGDEESELVWEDEEENIRKGDIKRTEDGLYVIVDTSWDAWNDEYADKEDGDDSDCFIDIYVLDKIKEFNEDFERVY